MANYETNQMLVAVKAYTRGNPLALDASSVWESQGEAQTYANSAIAYGGQIITAKMDDNTYKAFILNPGEGGYTLTSLGADPSAVKQYVIIGTRPGSGQEQGIIYIDNNVGYIWNGSDWVKIFEDVSSDIADLEGRIGTLETNIDLKAPLANPEFTGSMTLDGNALATQTWVNALIGQINNGVPGIVDGADNLLPSTGYKAGQMWRVAAAGTYAGATCEVGDLILCLKDYAEGSAGNTDFMVIQANIDGAVTGPDAATDAHIVIFDGATGKVIKDSNVSISSLNDAIAKSHEHANKTQLDTYTMNQTELLSEAHDDAASQISTLQSSITESLATKADSANVYTKSDIDDKLSTINTNLNTKVDSATVDSKIEEATPSILADATEAFNTKIGDLGESQTVVEYVTKVVGSGGTDVAEQIDEALSQAKAYTDQSLTIVEF